MGKDRQGVLVIGSMHHDTFYTLPRAMRMGENLHATSYQTACGGKGANQAVQCAKLAVPTRMIGNLGRDEKGDYVRAGMSAHGVNMELVERVDCPTGNACVWVYPNGEVQAALYGGANMRIARQRIDEIMPVLAETRVVILQNEIPMDVVECAITRAKAAGCTVIYNAAPALPVSEESLRAADVMVVNEAEASFYSGVQIQDVATAQQAARRLFPRLGGALIITLGAEGSVVVDEAGDALIPARKVEAVETTGAGDSYVGALAYGLIRGKSIREAAELASRVASVTVMAVGAQLAMPDLPTLRSMGCMGDGIVL